MSMEATRRDRDIDERRVLRSRTASGRLVTLGTASLKGRSFAPREKVLETRRLAHETAADLILKHRRELLGEE